MQARCLPQGSHGQLFPLYNFERMSCAWMSTASSALMSPKMTVLCK